MTTSLLVAIIMALVVTATPILIAALGELVVERSGVLNIGIDGMMLLGAVVTLIVIHNTGSVGLGVLAAAATGLVAALLFGLLAVGLGVNQIIAGLALSLFGASFSTLLGKPYIGRPIALLQPVFPSELAGHPLLKVVFGYPLPVYFSVLAVAAVAWFIGRTRAGTLLRATGEDHDSVHAMGYSVNGVRLAATAFGGSMAGIAGSCFPLMLTPQWANGLTSGRGWIALALVVFASWRPIRLAAGAYLFSAVLTIELFAKAGGVTVLPAEVWAALPYAATLAALTVISIRRSATSAAPECLGKPFTA